MAVNIPVATNTGATSWAFDPMAEPEDLRELDGWRPEQLWLSRYCLGRTAQDRMAEAVASAIDVVRKSSVSVVPGHELLLVLKWRRRTAAALRLTARILRGPSNTTSPEEHDLAMTALWLAAVRHEDLLAAVEFAAEVTRRAAVLDAGLLAEDPHLPPGVQGNAQLANRLRRCGREVLARHLTWSDMDSIGPCLAKAIAEDPLRKPGGQPGEVFS